MQGDDVKLYIRQFNERMAVLDDGSLQIYSSKVSDSGTYQCHARNIIGQSVSSANLTVRGRYSSNK